MNPVSSYQWPSTRPADLEKTTLSLPAIIIVVLVLSFLVRLAIAWAPVELLLRTVLADDSFYYLTIARNFAHGQGFSFDTLSETNGFHPLWMVFLLPIYLLIEERILAIHVVLTVSTILEAGSILILFRLLGEIGITMLPRTVAVVLYAFAPVLFSHAGPMNGMETPLNVLLTLAYLRQYWKVVSRDHFGSRALSYLGILAGLLMLARTDNIVLVVFTCLFLAWFSPSERRKVHLCLPTIFFPALIVLSPWMFWSFLKFGTFIQVSGVSVPFMIRMELNQQGWSTVDFFIQFAKNMANTITFFPVHLFETRILSLSGLMIAAVMLTISLALIHRERKQISGPRSAAVKFCLVLLGSGTLFVLVHTLRAIYMRGWYYMSLFPLLLLIGAIVIHHLVEHWPRRRVQWLTLLSLVILYGVSLPQLFKSRQGEVDKFRMVQTMNSVLRDEARVGSANAGVYGYFFERGIVVNLDGLVNNNAYESLKQRDLEAYCRNAGITHLVDPIGALERMAPFWNAERTSPLASMNVIHRESGRTPADTIVLGHFISTPPP